MSYQADRGSHIMEPNSVGLGMFASVGFHAVMFVGLAFFPAASETVKKPLRIVNLLPPPATSSDVVVPQAKTSTLEDILNNPLPDLSAGYPPLGNTQGGSLSADSDNSAFFGTNRNLNSRVDTSGLKTTDIPIRSLSGSSASSRNSSPKTSSSKTSSTSRASSPSSSGSQITPAPSSSTLPSPQFGSATTTVPPELIGAAPEPGPLPAGPSIGQTVSPFTGVTPSGSQPLEPQIGAIPPSQQTYQPIISRIIPHSYPQAACQEKATGRVSVDYFRKADGSLYEGTVQFDAQSSSAALNDAARNLVASYSEPGTGALQRYLSPFEFVYSDEACVVANSESSGGDEATTDLTKPTGAQPSSPLDPEKAEQEETKADTKKDKKKNKKKKDKNEENKKKENKTENKEESVKPETPKASPESKEPAPSPQQPAVSPAPAPKTTPSPVPESDTEAPVQATPKPVEPVAPKPAELKVEPAEKPPVQPAPQPAGNAADLVPVEPVKPAEPIDAQPIAPADVKLPELDKTPASE